MNRRGGDVNLVSLPELGVRGNTHFPMSDLNNLAEPPEGAAHETARRDRPLPFSRRFRKGAQLTPAITVAKEVFTEGEQKDR